MNQTAVAASPTSFLRGASVALSDLIALRSVVTDVPGPARSPTGLGGARRSHLRGRGIDFDEVRAYQPGDDVRAIDWRVTARTGKPHTKVFHEERERPVVTIVDARQNMAFGTRARFKSVAACELTALIAWRALDAGDRVGSAIATNNGVRLHRPQRSRAAVLRILADLAASSTALLGAAPTPPLPPLPAAPLPRPPASPFAQVLQMATRIARPGTLCMIASDFHDLDEACTTGLRALARHCDVLCVLVYDTLEIELPPPGLYPLRTGSTRRLLDAGNLRTRAEHHARFTARRNTLSELCRNLHMAFAALPTEASALTLLQAQGLWPRQR